MVVVVRVAVLIMIIIVIIMTIMILMMICTFYTTKSQSEAVFTNTGLPWDFLNCRKWFDLATQV